MATTGTTSAAFYQSGNPDLDVAVREFFKPGKVRQSLQTMAIFAALLENEKMTVKGKSVTQILDMAEVDQLAQNYQAGDGLTAGQMSYLGKAYWTTKRIQMPIQYDVDEEENQEGEAVNLNVVKDRTDKAKAGIKIKLYKNMYGVTMTTSGPSTIADASYVTQTATTGEDSRMGAGLRGALIPNATYGHLVRSASVNLPFQPSFISSLGDYSTLQNVSISLVRDGLEACFRYNEDKASDYLIVMGPSIHKSLKTQVEASHIYQRPFGERMLAKAPYGFETFDIDGVECVKDKWLTEANIPGSSNWMFFLNMKHWFFEISPKRAFKITPFVHQSQMPNGQDAYLARIMLGYRFYTDQPNASMYLSGVAA